MPLTVPSVPPRLCAPPGVSTRQPLPCPLPLWTRLFWMPPVRRAPHLCGPRVQCVSLSAVWLRVAHAVAGVRAPCLFVTESQSFGWRDHLQFIRPLLTDARLLWPLATVRAAAVCGRVSSSRGGVHPGPQQPHHGNSVRGLLSDCHCFPNSMPFSSPTCGLLPASVSLSYQQDGRTRGGTQPSPDLGALPIHFSLPSSPRAL